MSDSIAVWHAEHVNFATLLNRLEAELERFQEGGVPDYELMLDIMFYMTHYPDVLHHPKKISRLRGSKSVNPARVRSSTNWLASTRN